MKQQIQIQITGQKPFGDGNKFMNFSGNTPSGVLEGISWEAANHHYFTPGNRLIIEVGEDKSKDGAAFTEYKGKSRLEVTKTAQIAFASQEAAQASPAYQAPVYQAPAPQAAHVAPATHGDKLQPAMAKAALSCRLLVDELQGQGFNYEEAMRLASSPAPGVYPLWWFGEKGL